jgi:hypothetical protein
VKIFLAGNDGAEYAIVLHALGYPYRLCSYFYLSGPRSRARELVMDCANSSPAGSEWIMDSGLFSFMFGAEKGVLNTYEDYRGYAETYVAAMKEWGWKHAIVECDVQRVLGVPETERLRDEIFRPSGLETIYVWHIPEGEEGLTALAKKERRVALSVPEFRQVLGRGTGPHSAIMKGLRLIRAAGREDQRVHLLGNTQRDLLHAPVPADTCDSTSWLSGGQYGNGQFFDAKSSEVSTASVYSPKWRAWRKWCESHFTEAFGLLRDFVGENEKRWFYYGNAMCSAISYVLWMERLNGTKVVLTPPKKLPDSVRRFAEEKAEVVAEEEAS